MSAIPSEHSKKQLVWKTIKRSPFLSMVVAYICFNLFSAILMGGFSVLALLTNMFPALMALFLSAMYNEGRKSRVDES